MRWKWSWVVYDPVWYAYSLESAFVEECTDVEGSGGALQVVILFVADLWGILGRES